jgi:hypothetical protein
VPSPSLATALLEAWEYAMGIDYNLMCDKCGKIIDGSLREPCGCA